MCNAAPFGKGVSYRGQDCMCLGMQYSLVNNTILQRSKVQGPLWTSLTSVILVVLGISQMYNPKPKTVEKS